MNDVSALISADLTCAFFMVFFLIQMIFEKDRPRSTNAMIVTFIANIICILADAGCYTLNGFPAAIIYTTYFISYCCGSLTLLLFFNYWYLYIAEKSKISNMVRIIPAILLITATIITLANFFGGNIFKIENGEPIITGDMPTSASILQMLVIIYIAITVIMKRKQIGFYAVFLLGVFAGLPLVALAAFSIFKTADFSYAAATSSLILIYVLIQNRRTLENNLDHQEKLEFRNSMLYDQLEEIASLNIELKKEQIEKKKQYAVLDSLSKIYYSLHVIDLVNNTYVEFSANKKISEIMDPNNGARQMMVEVMKTVTADQHIEEALAFSDLSTIAERMKTKKIVSQQFIGKHVGWFLASFITMETDISGKPTKVIYATRVIDEEKKAEEKLIRKTQTDELTGLYNRRAYEEDINKNNCIPDGDKYTYISLDINELKVVNDTKGHAAGDELINGACSCMKEAIGPYGKIYRIGGDEFAAILACDEKEIKKILENFDHVISTWTGNLVEKLTISYGWINKTEKPGASVRELELEAEKRMYRAKTAHYRKSGVDRRGQQEAHKVLCSLYTKILKINLNNNSYKIINMNMDEKTAEKGFSESLSSWLSDFGNSGQIHKSDLKDYLKKTDLKYMKDYFAENRKPLHVFYRRKYPDGFKKVMLEIIATDDYSAENQNLYLYVKNIDD